MGGGWRWSVRALALLVALLVVGCAESEPSMALPQWTLEHDGETKEQLLPARLPLPPRPTTFVLRTTVELPDAMRGHELSLVFLQAMVLGRLRVDGEVLEPLAPTTFDRHRPAEMINVFRIPSRLTDRASLPLVYEGDASHGYASIFSRVPRLVLDPSGGRSLRAIVAFNRCVVYGAVAVSLVFAVIAAVPLASRQRVRGRATAEAWFFVMCAGMVAWLLCRVGVTELLGRDDLWLVPVVTTPLVMVGTIGFLHVHFGLERTPLIAIAIVSVLGVGLFVIAPTEFRTSSLSTRVLNLESGFAILYDFAALGYALVKLRARRFDAAILFVAWIFIIVAWYAGNILTGEARPPLQLVPVSWTLFMLAHAGLIARTHVAAQRDLNEALTQRIGVVEERNREVAVLNEELRRQIGDRAGALAEALARVGAVRENRARLRPGDLIARRYRIARTLGTGGMGAVYEVVRLVDERSFALKILSGATTGAALARFAREAQVSARFDHPNLVGVVDVEVDATGMLFVVMELVSGETLATAAKTRSGDSEWAREVLLSIATGLRVLHEHGIVHRDLKPANVLLARVAERDVVKIADFGIARLVDASSTETGEEDTVSADDPTFRDHALTRTGVLMGTPAYMAPELVHGAKDAPPSSDMWSFGVIAYELATGRSPFSEPPLYAAARGLRPRFADLPSTLPAWLSALIVRCLDDDAPSRPSSSDVVRTLTDAANAP